MNSGILASATPSLIRFLGRPPNIFQAIEEPALYEDVGEEGLVESLALQLRPRENDRGLASFWEASTGEEIDHVKAAFIAQKPHRPKRLDVLLIPLYLVEQAGLAVGVDHDGSAFSCVASLHRRINLASEERRARLARTILKAVRSGEMAKDQIYARITAGAIKPLIQGVYQECLAGGEEPEAEKASPWARREAVAQDLSP